MDDVYLLYPAVEDMDRRELETFITELDLGIAPSDYKNTEELRMAVLEGLGMD